MKILIVDGTSLFHEVVEEALKETEDATVLNSHSGKSALTILNENSVDFICVSMYLEDTDGVELTKTLRNTEQYKYTPIILLTSEESNDLYLKALSSGVTEVFHKKDIQQLINFIYRFTSQQQEISGHVLYVEDTLSQREMITKVFTSRGLKVDAFSTAEEAWDSYLQHDYDLVVTDIVLEGGMTGMALTNRIRRLNDEKGDVPILAITGFDDISRRIELFYLGVSDYVIKPLIEEELIARVKNLINSKQFHVESIRQRQRAEKADTAKSEFIAHMSHELRTPLNAILGFSELMITDPALPLADLQIDSMNEIKQAGNHLLGLINDILDISSIEAGETKFNIKLHPLATIIDTAISQITPFAKQHKVEIIPSSIPSDVLVNVDSVRLHQVILNLLSNAVKYNSEQGSIQVLYKVLNDNFVRIGIKDTGIGLTEEQQAQLFVPFNRAGQSNTIQGTGLGLVICRRYIEAMGGEIDLKSKPGHGSTFWIDLPS